MKSVVFVLVLACGGCGLAYGQSPAPKQMPDLGGLFQLPTTPENNKPQFKLQIPGDGFQAFALPEAPLKMAPMPNAPGDPGMVRRPKGFAQRQPHPAQPHNIYPDLKVLPIELAKLEAPGQPQNQFGVEPIPTTWPKARIEPIPTTWQGYRMVPITAAADGKTAKK
jgi:hypothetical protein